MISPALALLTWHPGLCCTCALMSPALALLQDDMATLAQEEGASRNSTVMAKLNNVLMQMRKNCNHPDLITSAFTQSMDYPTPEEMIR